jgi:hypothetical protein
VCDLAHNTGACLHTWYGIVRLSCKNHGDGLALASSEPSLHVMTMPSPRALTEITYQLSTAHADRDAGLNPIATGNGAVVFTPMERTMSE